MSEAAKPVEEPVVAPEAPVEAAAVEAAPAETTEAATEAPAATEPTTTEEAPAAPVKEEAKPAEEGVLGYKGPGLLKSFIFQKKFFWFGSEPVEHKSLTSYLRGEKQQEVANKNAAWSSHTGKGLLYFSKKASEKASPAGIINLSEVSDLTPDGTVDFSFSLGGHKHTFQATTLTERDTWLAALKTNIEEAKELATSVPETEEYKKSFGELTKPVLVIGAAAPKKSVDVKEEKKEEKAEAKEEKKEEKKEVKEEKKEEKKEARKSRSASRKRNSIFGSFGLGKKEEKTEVAKEETPAAPATEEPAAPVEPVVAEPVVAAPEPTTEAAPATEAAAAPAETKPVPTKRNSIFGSLKSSFANKEKKTTTDAPVVPPKDAEPVSENAPVIPPVETSETPAAAETTEAVPATNGETKAAVETPAPKTRKGSSSLPWLSKKEKPATSDEEVEKPKSPFAKLRETVKGKSSPKAPKATEKPAEAKEDTAAPAEATPAVEEPVVSEPVPVVQQTPAPVAASA
ncbi:hypothetical protein N431DRAFT_443939 [Stipitochalara longipes BDJ]|nr:hypothetical protein N431DRAFT_443939 [Stipitochalara longipes BDJ]